MNGSNLKFQMPYSQKQKKQNNFTAISLPEHQVIGMDESGVGDYFGSVVAASCWIKDLSLINDFKIKDSKTFTNHASLCAEFDKLKLFHNKFEYYCFRLRPDKYNILINKYHLNAHHIKTLVHTLALSKLIQNNKSLQSKKTVLDKFCSEKNWNQYQKDLFDPQKNVKVDIKLLEDAQIHPISVFETKADSKYYAVALSSMIARYIYIKDLKELSKQYNLNLQPGANSKIKELVKAIKAKRKDIARHVIKMHFKV